MHVSVSNNNRAMYRVKIEDAVQCSVADQAHDWLYMTPQRNNLIFTLRFGLFESV